MSAGASSAGEWVDRVVINGRKLKAGDLLRFTGARGEYKLLKAHMIDGECESLQVVGGTNTRGGNRYFKPSQFKGKVRVPKTRRFGAEE